MLPCSSGVIPSFASLVKTPADELDYECRYHRWLADGDVIVESTWTIAGPDTSLEAFNASIFEGTYTVIWLKGGTVGATYSVSNTITTDTGRKIKRSFDIRVVEHL